MKQLYVLRELLTTTSMKWKFPDTDIDYSSNEYTEKNHDVKAVVIEHIHPESIELETLDWHQGNNVP